MSEYLEAREEAGKYLDFFDEVSSAYKALVQGGPDRSGAAELVDYVQSHAPMFKEYMGNIQNDPNLGAVLGAEPGMSERLARALHFWQWLRDSHLVDDLIPQDPPPKEAITSIPPEPGAGIDGTVIMEYLAGLQKWLTEASDELWGESSPINVPPLGERYSVGDWKQTFRIAHTMNEGVTLRSTWLQLSSCGHYWDTVAIGSARARMIFKALEIMNDIIYPDAPQRRSDQGPFGFMDSILGPMLPQ